MRTISADLLAALSEGKVATLCLVTLKNSKVYGYTDHDVPVTIDGQVYAPAAGMTAIQMHITNNASVSTQNLQAGWTPIISEQAVLQGVYDYAQVSFALYSWDNPALGSVPIFAGRLGLVKYTDQGFQADIFSNMWSLSQFIGIEFTANCRHRFGGGSGGIASVNILAIPGGGIPYNSPPGQSNPNAGGLYIAGTTIPLTFTSADGSTPTTPATAVLTSQVEYLGDVGGLNMWEIGLIQVVVTNPGAGYVFPVTATDEQTGCTFQVNPLGSADPNGVGFCGVNTGALTFKGTIVGEIINEVAFYATIDASVPATPNSPNAPSLTVNPVYAQQGGSAYLDPTMGAPYTYSVSAIVDGVESAPSPTSSAYILQALNLQTNWKDVYIFLLSGNQIGSTITVGWDAVPNATAYNVYGRGSQTVLATVTGTSWTDDGSSAGGTVAPPYGDYFAQGFLTMTSGQAIGLSREVKYAHSGQIALWLPLERPVAVGDTFTITAGCVKTTSACQYKFNNLSSFGGFPGIQPEIMYRQPRVQTGGGGKKG